MSSRKTAQQYAHGTAASYDEGCRCLPCAVAKSRKHQAWKQGESWRELTVSALGTARRLQALNAIGWSWIELGALLGMHKNAWRLANYPPSKWIPISTAERVKVLYDELSMAPWPTGTAAVRARIAAARKGYAPPLAWDDDEIDDPLAEPQYGDGKDVIDYQAIERAVKGDEKVKLTQTERRIVAKTLFDSGKPVKQIIRQLHMSAETIKAAVA